MLHGTTWTTVSDGSSHRRSKIEATRGILPSASDTSTETKLLESTCLDYIAEVKCLRACRVARSFELSIPDWLFLRRAPSDDSVGTSPGRLRTNTVLRTSKLDQHGRIVRKQQSTWVNGRWDCVRLYQASLGYSTV
jgi:hypothetical protein